MTLVELPPLVLRQVARIDLRQVPEVVAAAVHAAEHHREQVEPIAFQQVLADHAGLLEARHHLRAQPEQRARRLRAGYLGLQRRLAEACDQLAPKAARIDVAAEIVVALPAVQVDAVEPLGCAHRIGHVDQRCPDARLAQIVPERLLRQPGRVGVLEPLMLGPPHLAVIPAVLVQAGAVEEAGPDQAQEALRLIAQPAPGAASTAAAGANRRSFSHVKIRLAFSACRRATCATETPGALVSRQIERFSSALQRRYLRRRGINPGNGVSTICSGHPRPPPRP